MHTRYTSSPVACAEKASGIKIWITAREDASLNGRTNRAGVENSTVRQSYVSAEALHSECVTRILAPVLAIAVVVCVAVFRVVYFRQCSTGQ